jgi:hypothetical protein
MPNLTNLDVEWVSLVDRAAVRDPVEQSEPMRFLIWKRDTTDTDPSKGGRPMKLTKEMVDQLGDRVEKADDLTKLVEKSENAEQAGLALDGAARLLAAHKAELPPDILVELAKAAGVDLQLEKAGPKFGTPEWEEKYGTGKKAEPKSAAELVESLKKSDMDPAIVTEVESALAKAAEKDDLAKADPAMRARIEKAEGEAKEAKEIAKAERDTRLTKEFVAKAQGFEGLSLEAEKFGPVLKEASEKLSKESYAELERVLKGADEGITASELFKEQGANGASEGGDATKELTAKAEEIRKSDSKLTQAEALDKAMRDNPDLQQRYLDEVRG